ncbi:MAG: F0F1 ATP synthase subunit alpha [Kiritimatiellae bacterium]|nr:F0F1 ATP synthase subunit alpha [Kiritimatiellia bacterium]
MALKINLIQLKEHGKIAEIKQDVVSVTGLTNCMNGQLVTLAGHSSGVIVGFDPDYVLVLVVKAHGQIKPGDDVVSTIDEFRVPVGDAFIGRRVNALSEPIDNNGSIRESMTYPIFGIAPSVLERVPLNDVLQSGTKIVDMTLPIGKGQRMLLLGDRMTGKTTVAMDAILSQKGRNVICIYCSIGKSEAALGKVIDTYNKENVWDYGLIVAATAADPMGQQYLSPYVASSIGEYFMYEKNMDVLVVFDDFTKHAWAYRQISLLLERAPGRDAYPGDIFYIHSQLVERAGKLNEARGGGSMTHLPIVETLEGDFAGYVPSNIISMTDGQVYLSANLFGEGFKPAIDMGLSVSRIGSKVQWPAMKKQASMLKMDYIRYKQLEKMTRIKAGVSADVEVRLKKGRSLEELLKQGENVPVPIEDQVIILFARENGFLEDIEPADVRDQLTGLLKQIKLACPDLMDNLRIGKKLTDEIKEGLNEQLTRFFNTIV